MVAARLLRAQGQGPRLLRRAARLSSLREIPWPLPAQADLATRVRVISQLQREVGNAQVQRMLAASGGEAAGLQRAPDGGAVATQTPAAATPTATPDAGVKQEPAADAKALLNEELKSNKDYAAWVLKAHDQGFVLFSSGMGTEDQLKKLKEGTKIGNVDPGQSDILGALQIMHEVAKGPIGRWVAKPEGDKPTITLGSMVRAGESAGPHGKGAAIDINQGDFDGNANDVITVLGDLDKGSYGIGLPFQGDFFPADKNIATLEAAEAKKPTPGEISGALKKFTQHTYKATYNAKDKTWSETIDTAGGASALLKSDDLRKQLKKMKDAGSTLMIFPDNDNHLHLDSR
jgi:hypothetical protein